MITIIIISNSNISAPFVIFFWVPNTFKDHEEKFLWMLEYLYTRVYSGLLTPFLYLQISIAKDFLEAQISLHWGRFSISKLKGRLNGFEEMGNHINLIYFFISRVILFFISEKKTRPIKVHYLSKFDCFPFMTKLIFFLQYSPFPFFKFTFARDALLRICLRHLSFISIFVKIRLVFLSDTLPHPPVAGATLTSLPQRWFLDHFEIGKYGKNS